MFQIFTVLFFISILIPTFRFKFPNLIYSSNTFYNKRNFGTLDPSYYGNVSFKSFTMAVNSPQPTLLCVIILFVRLSSLDDQDVPFLDFFVLSIVIFVVPTREFVGRGGLENLATGHGTWERAEVRGVWATENSPRRRGLELHEHMFFCSCRFRFFHSCWVPLFITVLFPYYAYLFTKKEQVNFLVNK